MAGQERATTFLSETSLVSDDGRMCWRVDGACLSGQRSVLAKGTQHLATKKCFSLTEMSYFQTVWKQATRIKKPGFGGFIC